MSPWLHKQRRRRRTQSQRSYVAAKRRYLLVEQLERRYLLATFAVNSVADTIDVKPGDGLARDSAGNTTLRAAIMEANAAANADTISLPAGKYLLTRTGALEDVGATGDLDITRDLTIVGADAASTIPWFSATCSFSLELISVDQCSVSSHSVYRTVLDLSIYSEDSDIGWE